MNIKVCGITQLKQLQELDDIGIEFAGLNFYKGSPRCVIGKIKAEDLNHADFDLRKVGVFVDENARQVMKTVEEYSLDCVQLHGDESPEYCKRLSEDVEVIKALGMNGDIKAVERMLRQYDDACDYYLFDSSHPATLQKESGEMQSFGGSGKQFEWNILPGLSIEKPFFLAGGISIQDVVKVKGFNHPDLFAVDINSKFEISPGIKDMDLIKMFAQVLRN